MLRRSKMIFVRTLSLILCAVMLLSNSPMNAIPEWLSGLNIAARADETIYGDCGDTLSWHLDTSTCVLSITGIGEMFSYLDLEDVPWFLYRESIREVAFVGSVTSIGDYAFYKCTNLASVTIPNSVTSIGRSAFEYCENLASITIGSNVTSIGKSAFEHTAYYNDERNWDDGVLYVGRYLILAKDTLSGSYSIVAGTKCIADHAFWCTSLLGVSIPYSVTSIGEDAFTGCKIESISIPSSVTAIGIRAFFKCRNLKTISIPDTVTQIGMMAFQDTAFYADENNWVDGALYSGKHLIAVKESLEGEYSIISGTKCIAGNAFAGTEMVNSVIIPNSVESISDYAFRLCKGLESVMIPNGVKRIGVMAFSECAKLTKVTIPESVTSIGMDAFEFCESLVSITVSQQNAYYKSDANGVLYNKDQTELIQYPTGNLRNTFAIPEGVEIIGAQAFCRCNNLLSVTIPESVTDICRAAFAACVNLTSATIGSNVVVIGADAFSDCSCLEKVSIPDSVIKIYQRAFIFCSSLLTVTLGSRVTSIGDDAFRACTSLKRIVIPNSVTALGDCAFEECVSLESITLGNGLKKIGDYAFSGCESFESVTIPDSVSSIGRWAFGYCEKLASITIGKNVTSIGNDAFAGCHSLVKVDYTGTVADWCGISFENSRSNPVGENLYIMGTLLTDLTIPNSVTNIENYAFEGCASLESVTIPGSAKKIGECAFRHCYNLVNVTIQHGVTFIGARAFDLSFYLSSVTIPNSVTEIGEYAFSGIQNIVYNGIASGSPWGAYNVNLYPEGPFLFESVEKKTLLYCNRTAQGHIAIPETVDTVERGAFENCVSLTSVTIPNGVTRIGSYAFCGCVSISSVTIGNKVAHIEPGAFLVHCEPDLLSELQAEYNDALLSEKTRIDGIPLTVYKKILECPNGSLADVYYNGAQTQWDSIEIGEDNDDLLQATIHCLGDSLPHSHIYSSEITTQPTCTAMGQRSIVCSICGDRYTEDTPALGHSYGEWILTTPPSADAESEETRTCVRCRQAEKRSNGVVVEYADGCFTGQVTLIAFKIEQESISSEMQRYEFDIGESGTVQAFYLIHMVDENGDEAELKEGYTVTLRIPIPINCITENCIVFHKFQKKDGQEELESFRKRNGTLRQEDGFLVVEVSCFSPFVVAVEEEPTVSIRNNPGMATLRYGETLALTAEAGNLPDGAKLVWEADNACVVLKPSADGKICEVTSKKSGTVAVTVKIVDADGSPIKNGDEEIAAREIIQSKASFFFKLKWFFKRLFGIQIRTVQTAFKPE